MPIQPKTSNILPKFCRKLATALARADHERVHIATLAWRVYSTAYRSPIEDPRFVEEAAMMGRKITRLNYEKQIVDMEWTRTYKSLRAALMTAGGLLFLLFEKIE